MTRAELMRYRVLEDLKEVDAVTRKNVICNVERYLGHSLTEAESYEKNWIRFQIRLYLQIELNQEIWSDTALQGELCPSCGQFDVIFENGCSRCLNCGFGKCDL